jgi:hypothetical protein
MSSPDGQVSGDAGDQLTRGLGGWAGKVRHPVDLHEGYHAATEGKPGIVVGRQGRLRRAPERVRPVRAGCTPSAGVIGLCQADGMPHQHPQVQRFRLRL